MVDGSIKYKETEDQFIKLQLKLWVLKAITVGRIGIII